MNVVQALAVAAAALAISGDPLGLRLSQAEAGIEAMVAQGEALAQRIVAKAELKLETCPKQREPRAHAHKLPDTSIHAAVSSARL